MVYITQAIFLCLLSYTEIFFLVTTAFLQGQNYGHRTKILYI